MKKNTLIKIFSVVLCLLMLVACGKESAGSSKTAVWEGYKDVAFDKFLKEGFVDLMADDDVIVTKSNTSVENGWGKSGMLDEKADLAEGFTAVTYSLDVADSEMECTYAFFMAQDADGVLVCEGAALIVDGNSMDIPKADAEEALGQLIPYME